MASVTYNGDVPIVTPSLAADGDVTLGLWQPGESKDVADEIVDSLCALGSAFSSAQDGARAGAPTQQNAQGQDQDQAPALEQDQDQKPRRSFLARARGAGQGEGEEA